MKRHLIYLLLPVLVLSGCVTDEYVSDLDGGDAAGIETTLTLQVPASGFTPLAATRALGATDENAIDEVDVLVFEKATAAAADNTAVYFDRAQTVSVQDAGTDSKGVKRSFRVSVRKSDKPLQFVVLANCRDMVDDAVATFTKGTTTRPDALEALVISAPAQWNVDPTSTGYKGLPMSGQTQFRTLTDAASFAATVDMTRSHARIDVKVAASAQDEFKLGGVRLYNPSTKGWIVPDPWPSSTIDGLANRGTAPAPFVYTPAVVTEATKKAMEGTIYTFEAPAAAAANSQTAPFLVVGGSWNGQNETYYRIDFHDGSDFLSLRRNYQYVVEIADVNGLGFPSIAAAMDDSFTDRITTNVHEWAQGKMGTAVWDGKDWLTVSETDLSFYPEEQDVEIYIATSVASWKAEVPASANWITLVSGGTGTGDATNPPVGTMKLKIAKNTTGDREAVIPVIAGRLRQDITIKQSLAKELKLELGEAELIFTATAPQSKNLRVEWAPGFVNATVAGAAASGYAAVSLPAFSPVIDNNTSTPREGTADYPIKPNAFTPSKLFEERRSVVTFTAKDGTEASATQLKKTVVLRQFDYAISVMLDVGTKSGARVLVDTSTRPYEQLKTYSLNVKSNDEWTVAVSDPDGVLAIPPSFTGEPNTVFGETITFHTSDRTHNGQQATLTFSHVNDPTVTQDVVIKMQENEANSYIVNPGETQLIQISKVFAVWGNDADLKDTNFGDPSAMSAGSSYSTELLWQDTQSLIASAADITQPTIDHTNKTGSFTVKVADKTGNAVVVLRENGVIRWSWHIWVTDYDPDADFFTNAYNGTAYMNRNLGATSTTPGDVGTFGFYYQWGRKDPFPGPMDISSSTNNTCNSRPIYNIYNVVLPEEADDSGAGVKKTPVAVGRNLRNAIENPLTFYLGTAGNMYDWYSNYPHANGSGSPVAGPVSHRVNLWGSNQNKGDLQIKSQYDPCPDGWQIPHTERLMLQFVTPGIAANGGVITAIGFAPFMGWKKEDTGNFTSLDYQVPFASADLYCNYNPNSATMYAFPYFAGNVRDNQIVNGYAPGTASGVVVRCQKIV